MSGDYGSMRRNEFRDDPNQDPNRYDAELNKVRSNVANMNNHISKLELLFREISGDTIDAGRVHEVRELQSKVQEVMERCKQQLIRLNNFRVADKGLRMKADRIRREFETAARKFQDLAQAILQTLRASSGAAAAGDSQVLVDVDDEEPLTAQEQADKEAELAINIGQEEEMERMANDIANIEDMFRDLNEQVVDQGEMIESIGNNVNQAYDNVESANEQLAHAVENKRKVRKRCIILIVILLVILGIVGLIIGLSVGH